MITITVRELRNGQVWSYSHLGHRRQRFPNIKAAIKTESAFLRCLRRDCDEDGRVLRQPGSVEVFQTTKPS
jgi:hypothetical protein